MNIASCTNAPFQPPGIAVKALYFTKAAGEKNFNVYAQYNDGKAWVPLHIAFPAHPSLQQVRDIDRNIALNSGSYDNAHFYLRSADGNNMAAAYFTNAAGGGIQVGNKNGYAPLNLQPDGGLLTYRGNEVATKADFTSGTGYLYANGSVISFDNNLIKSGVNWGPNMMGVTQNSILYHYGNEPDNPSGDSTGYSINGSVGGVSSVQLFIATGNTSGFNPDGFYWRGNNSGGPGWPGPWKQVASREWVNNNFTSTAHTHTLQQITTAGNTSTNSITLGASTAPTHKLTVVDTLANSNALASFGRGGNDKLEIRSASSANFVPNLIGTTSSANTPALYFTGKGKDDFGTAGTFTFSARNAAATAGIIGGKLFSILNYTTEYLKLSHVGELTLSNLSGTGTRMIVANASGALSAQAIPTESDPIWTAASANTMTYKGAVTSAADLNTYTTTGYYSAIQAVAGSLINCPTGSPFILEVLRNTSSGMYITQRLTANGNAMYRRTSFDSGTTWSTWNIASPPGTLTPSTTNSTTATSHTHAITGVLSLNCAANGGTTNITNTLDANSILLSGMQYCGTGSTNLPPGYNAGFIISNIAGVSGWQMFMNHATEDDMWYRKRAASIWGEWYRIASREWVSANFLSAANVINAQYASAQNANFWVDGSARAQHFVANSLGYTMTAQSGYYGFFTDTGLSAALPVKAKEMVLSDSYADAAPVNGLFVKGAVVLKSLAGNGNEMLVTDNTGNISTQPLPSGTLPVGNVLLSADNPVIDLSVNAVANNRLGGISIYNNSGNVLNNVSVTVAYTQPYAVVAKATINAANISAGQAMATNSYVYFKDNNAAHFVIFIKEILPGNTLAFDYNVQGY